MGEIEKSAGSADDEMKIVSESITFKLNAFKQTWVQFLTDVINRKSTGQFIDNLTAISEKFIDLLEKDPVPTLMGVAGALKLILNLLKGNAIAKSVNAIAGLINQLSVIKAGIMGSGGVGLFGAALSPIKQAYTDFKNVGSTFVQVADDADEAGLAALEMANGVRTAENAMNTAGNTARSTSSGISLLTATFTSLLPVLVAIAGVGAAYAVYKYATRWEEVAKKAEEAKDRISEVRDEQQRTQELFDKYDKLSKGVNTSTNRNISLSNDEYEEYLDTIEELVRLHPRLYSTLDENGNAILNFSDKTKDASENLKEFLEDEEKVANYKIAKELPTLFGGVAAKQNSINMAAENIEKYKNELDQLTVDYRKDIEELISANDDIAESYKFTVNTTTKSGQLFYNTISKGIKSFIADAKELNSARGSELESLLNDDSVIYDKLGNGTQTEFFLSLYALSDEERQSLIESIRNSYQELSEDYDELIVGEYLDIGDKRKELEEELSIAQQELETEWIDFRGNLVSAMKSKASYQGLGDAGKELASALVGNLESDVAVEMDDQHPDQWVSDNIITPLRMAFDKDDSKELSHLVTKLLTLDEDDINRIDIVNQIQQWLKDNNINVEIDFTPVLTGAKKTKAIDSSFEASLSHISESAGSRRDALDDYKRLAEYTKDFSNEDKQTWLEVTKGCRTAVEAINAFGDAQREALSGPNQSDIVTSVSHVATRLKPQFDALAKAYKQIFYDEDKKGKKGFSLDKVDAEMMDNLRTTFLGIDKELKDNGVTFEVAPINEFLDVITSAETKSKSLAEQQEITKQAINDLATSYFYAAEGLQDLNDETKDALKQQFKSMGVTNADEIVDQIQYTQELRREVADTFSDLSLDDIDFVSKIQGAEDALNKEYEKLQNWGLSQYKGAIEGEDTFADLGLSQVIKNKFGNVDMDKRTVIRYNEEIVDSFEEALKSWEIYSDETGEIIGSYYDEVKQEVEEGWDKIDTVFGGYDTFKLDTQEIEVAFTPIMVDENGENPEFLSKGTVTNYIQKVLNQANEEIAKSGEEWSEEAVIKKAFEIDFKGMNTEEIDSQGRVVGQKYVQGVMAAIGEEAIDVGSLLHFSGEEGAIQLAQEELDVYNSLKEKLETNTLSLNNVTAQEIALLQTEGVVSEAAGQQLAILALKKQLAAGITFGEQGNIDQIIALAKAAGVGAEYLTLLARAKSLAAQVDAGNFGRYAELQALQDQINNYDWEKDLNLDIDFSVDPEAAKSSGGKAGKDAANEYVKNFEEELKKLKEKYERGELTLGDYLNQYKALIEKYFSDTEKYAEERAKALHDYMQELKGYYDSAISGVTTLIDKRISAVQKQKDKALKAIEEERKAAKAALEERKKAIEEEIKAKQKEIKELERAKKPLEDEIKAIQDAAAARERNLNLQKSLYELEKAQTTRTQFIYKNGQMVYQQDTDAIHNAKENKTKAEEEVRIATIQKQIDALDKAIDLKNQEIDLLEEESSMIDEQLAAIDEFYDKLVEQTTKSFDAILEQLEKQKSKWEELAEIQTIANAYKEAKDVMDMLGISMEDVLNDAPGAFEKFKDGYVQALLGAEGENANFVDGINYALSQAETGFQKVSDKATSTGKDIADSLDAGTKSIETFGNTADTSSGKVSNLASSAKTLTDNTKDTAKQIGDIGTSLSTVDGTALDPLKAKLEEVKNLINGPDNSLLSAINTLGEQIDIEPVVEKFTELQGAIDNVVTSLGGGGGESSSASGGFVGNTNAQVTAMSNNSGGGNGSGLTGAIEAVKEAADTYIGTGGGEGGEGEEGGGTAIADFDALNTAVGNVTASIGGGGGSEGSSYSGFVGNTNAQVNAMKGSGGGGGDLISAVESFGETNTEVLKGGQGGDGGAISEWTELNGQLEIADGYITSMAEALGSLKESYETTLKVTLEVGNEMYTGTATVNGGHARYQLNILEAMGLPGESWTSENMFIPKGGTKGKAKIDGTANINGNWGYEGGRTMIAEIGPELVVYPNGTFETFDHPQIVDLPRGSVIFNHIQTGEILDPNNQVKRKGKSNLNGTLPNGLRPLSEANPEQYQRFMQSVEFLKENTKDMQADLSSINYATDDIKQAVQNITNTTNNTAPQITFGDLNFTCTGITSQEVLGEVKTSLEQAFAGMSLKAYQRAMA